MTIDIITGDCRNLIKNIETNSIDLIFTDPPYLREYLYLYEWLAGEDIQRIIKPNGLIVMYVGCYYLAEVIKLIGDKLEYFMEAIILGSGYGSMIWNRRVIGRHKSLLIYRPVGGQGIPRCNITSVFTGTGSDKRYHVWGQDEASARYYIDCLSSVGANVYDPFCGGCTTPAMCKVLGRNCISHEIDANTASVASERVKNQQMPLSLELISNQSFVTEAE